MNYRVIWRWGLENALAAIYLFAREQGHDTAAINTATEEIDRLLKQSPQTQGESREPPTRVLIVPPLTVDFEVYEDEQVVLVTFVRYQLPRS
jgi:hypothetical protein